MTEMTTPIRVRKEPQLAAAFRKDPRDEAFLDQLNAILAPYEEREYEDLDERHPTLHIIGVPRSGTTLLSQLISTHLNVGYINHLIAAFWRAPVYGVRLSQKLLGPDRRSSYQSCYGRTTRISEPHEFGYFWSSLLRNMEMRVPLPGDEDRIDWQRVRLILLNITHAFGCPVVFKSWLLGWYLARMQTILPKSCFVLVRRDPVETALSLIKMRKEFLGSVERWASLKPAEVDELVDEPYWVQAAGQVYYLEQGLRQHVRAVDGRNVLEVDYGELCRSPRRILQKSRELLRANGGSVGLRSDPPESFERSTNRTADVELRTRVEQAIERFYGQVGTER